MGDAGSVGVTCTASRKSDYDVSVEAGGRERRIEEDDEREGTNGGTKRIDESVVESTAEDAGYCDSNSETGSSTRGCTLKTSNIGCLAWGGGEGGDSVSVGLVGRGRDDGGCACTNCTCWLDFYKVSH